MRDFDRILRLATRGIERSYFQLPVHGRETPVYRERVYCYELYHQIRKRWPESAYKLGAEIDKSGAPTFHGLALARVKPDLLIHVPEDRDNFAAIEVKPINGSANGVRKDIRTLLAFRGEPARYQRAILLIYGAPGDGTALRYAQRYLAKEGLAEMIELWSHEQPATRAVRVEVHNVHD